MPTWKKYEMPPTMLDVERKTKTIGLSGEQIDREWLRRIQTKIDTAPNNDTKQAWIRRKVRLEEKMAKAQIDDEFAKDFTRWLTGRSPWNSKERIIQRYDENGVAIVAPVGIKRVECCPWGNQPLVHVPGVTEFVDQGLDRREAVVTELTKLKMRTPRTLDEAYIYYKYICRNYGIDGESVKELDDLFHDFDYPRRNGPNGEVEVRGPQGDTSLNNGMGPGAPPRFDENQYNADFTYFWNGIYGAGGGAGPQFNNLQQLNADPRFHNLGPADQATMTHGVIRNALGAAPAAQPEARQANVGPNTANQGNQAPPRQPRPQGRDAPVPRQVPAPRQLPRIFVNGAQHDPSNIGIRPIDPLNVNVNMPPAQVQVQNVVDVNALSAAMRDGVIQGIRQTVPEIAGPFLNAIQGQNANLLAAIARDNATHVANMEQHTNNVLNRIGALNLQNLNIARQTVKGAVDSFKEGIRDTNWKEVFDQARAGLAAGPDPGEEPPTDEVRAQGEKSTEVMLNYINALEKRLESITTAENIAFTFSGNINLSDDQLSEFRKKIFDSYDKTLGDILKKRTEAATPEDKIRLEKGATLLDLKQSLDSISKGITANPGPEMVAKFEQLTTAINNITVKLSEKIENQTVRMVEGDLEHKNLLKDLNRATLAQTAQVRTLREEIKQKQADLNKTMEDFRKGEVAQTKEQLAEKAKEVIKLQTELAAEAAKLETLNLRQQGFAKRVKKLTKLTNKNTEQLETSQTEIARLTSEVKQRDTAIDLLRKTTETEVEKLQADATLSRTTLEETQKKIEEEQKKRDELDEVLKREREANEAAQKQRDLLKQQLELEKARAKLAEAEALKQRIEDAAKNRDAIQKLAAAVQKTASSTPGSVSLAVPTDIPVEASFPDVQEWMHYLKSTVSSDAPMYRPKERFQDYLDRAIATFEKYGQTQIGRMPINELKALSETFTPNDKAINNQHTQYTAQQVLSGLNTEIADMLWSSTDTQGHQVRLKDILDKSGRFKQIDGLEYMEDGEVINIDDRTVHQQKSSRQGSVSSKARQALVVKSIYEKLDATGIGRVDGGVQVATHALKNLMQRTGKFDIENEPENFYSYKDIEEDRDLFNELTEEAKADFSEMHQLTAEGTKLDEIHRWVVNNEEANNAGYRERLKAEYRAGLALRSLADRQDRLAKVAVTPQDKNFREQAGGALRAAAASINPNIQTLLSEQNYMGPGLELAEKQPVRIAAVNLASAAALRAMTRLEEVPRAGENFQRLSGIRLPHRTGEFYTGATEILNRMAGTPQTDNTETALAVRNIRQEAQNLIETQTGGIIENNDVEDAVDDILPDSRTMRTVAAIDAVDGQITPAEQALARAVLIESGVSLIQEVGKLFLSGDGKFKTTNNAAVDKTIHSILGLNKVGKAISAQ